jgi:hypothetical protein
MTVCIAIISPAAQIYKTPKISSLTQHSITPILQINVADKAVYLETRLMTQL